MTPDLLAARLRTPLQIEQHLTLALETGYQASEKPVGEGIVDSVLSKQVSTLEQAGYVRVRKGYVGKRPRTWLSLTRAGRDAYTGHLGALREIAGA